MSPNLLYAAISTTVGAPPNFAPVAASVQADGRAVLLASSASVLLRQNLVRPANQTAYSAGDVIGDAATGILTFPNFGDTGDNMLLTTAAFRYDVSSVPTGMGKFRLHIYTTIPAAVVDNAAFSLISGDRAGYVGWLDLPEMTALGASAFTQVSSPPNKHVKLAGTSLFAILQTVAGFIPAANSETFAVELGGVKL